VSFGYLNWCSHGRSPVATLLARIESPESSNNVVREPETESVNHIKTTSKTPPTKAARLQLKLPGIFPGSKRTWVEERRDALKANES